jgi:uncharacterized membrane protein YbhN (UPF0104 family)
MLALIVVASLLAALRWHHLPNAPQLKILWFSLTACLVAAIIGGLGLLAAPSLLSPLRHYARLARLVDLIEFVSLAFRKRPAILAQVFALSLLGQCATLLAFEIIAHDLAIGNLAWLDYLISASFAFVANMLPFTLGGLGVGEAAFDHLCTLFEPTASGAPYASIFFAFRAVSLLTLLPGVVSFIVYRSDPGSVREA